MKKPKLKTPPNPEFAYMDLDAPLFAAASAGEQVVYVAKTPEGGEVARFNSAAAYKNWLEISEELGIDMDFGYEGNFDLLERHTEFEVKDFKECVKAFDHIINHWFKKSGCKEWIGYVSKASGEKNFRYDVATVKPYKGNRSGARKPEHLEALRKYVRELPNVKVPRGPYEVDDLVCAKAQAKGWKGCVVSVDKDSLGSCNTHVLIPDEMDKPQFSSQKVLGHLWKNEKGKVVGLGTLFWLYQILAGDSVDNIPGCKGVGSAGAYKLLETFSGVDKVYLTEALEVVCEAFKKGYGETYDYTHCTSGEAISASYVELACEMSQLVYMKKNKADVCFWLGDLRAVANAN